MRKPIIAGNWKMNKTIKKAVEFARELVETLNDCPDMEIIVFPPFTALYAVAGVVKDTNILFGAQNMYYESAGAYTGEVSPLMLADIGVHYVILGHSERREILGETDEIINLKIKAALNYRMKPILCVGEKIEEREKGKAEEVVHDQLVKNLHDISKDEMARTVLAYEPLWAIGTGKTASAEDANKMHAFIRATITSLYDKRISSNVRIQYGGSVRPDNIDILMAQPEIDGALVGGASLDVESFVKIVRYKRSVVLPDDK
ncbi:triose-phosphate isomerase [bacterium]|nr:triose-phosphate isomerase [bacterium]